MNKDAPNPKSIAERLSQTGSKIAELSKQAASATKDAMVKVADAGKGAVAKTNQAVTNAVEAKKERKEEKLTEKIEQTKAELKDDGFIEVAPAMITLPEFEEERMALMAEEHDILVDLVDHMHALSTRIDQLENTYRALAIEEKNNAETVERNLQLTKPAILRLLFVSLGWVSLLVGLDQIFTQNQMTIISTYPAEIFSWGIGTGIWVVFVLHKMGKAAPMLKLTKSTLVQVGFFTTAVSLFLLLLSEDRIATISTVYIAGLVVAMAVILISRLINEEVDIID
jgi:hypothetical protein